MHEGPHISNKEKLSQAKSHPPQNLYDSVPRSLEAQYIFYVVSSESRLVLYSLLYLYYDVMENPAGFELMNGNMIADN